MLLEWLRVAPKEGLAFGLCWVGKKESSGSRRSGLEAEVLKMTKNGSSEFLLLGVFLESGIYVRMEHIS